MLLDHGAADSPYENALTQAPAGYTETTLNQDDLYAILYTSGTTGLPKGAIITHGMVFYNAVNIGGPALITPESKHLSVLPLFHIAGLNIFSNPVFHAGGTVVVTQTFDPAESLSLLSDPAHAFTHFFGVPANYLFISQQPAFADVDLSHLKVCGVGGAPCALSILEAFSPKGVDVQQGYGMTETSPYLTLSILKEHLKDLPQEKQLEYKAKTGRPFITVDLKVVDENGSLVDPDGRQVGEILVKGDTITPGYWNRPEENQKSFHKGWLRTEDLAVVDKEGYVNIVDRKKDMIISGGENIYSTEVENVLYMNPKVLETAVFGVPDEKWGEAVKAAVVLKDNEKTTEEEIISFCKKHQSSYKVPKSIDFLSELPKTGSGKIYKKALRDPYWKKEL